MEASIKGPARLRGPALPRIAGADAHARLQFHGESLPVIRQHRQWIGRRLRTSIRNPCFRPG